MGSYVENAHPGAGLLQRVTRPHTVIPSTTLINWSAVIQIQTSHMGTMRHVRMAAIWTLGHKSKKADESRCVCLWRVLCPNISKFDQEL